VATVESLEKILQDIQTELRRVADNTERINPKAVATQGGLSDINSFLGTVTAGEFRTGNGKDPGKGFTGVRIAYPSLTYGSSAWHLVGVTNDVLQFGLSASDGKAYFGGGVHILDGTGYFVYDADGLGQRPEITFQAGASPTAKGRIAGYSAAANESGAYLMTNSYFTGTNWHVDLTTKRGTIFQGSANASANAVAFQWRSVPAGSGAQTPVELMTLTHEGMLANRKSSETIASGTITVESNRVTVDTESGASSDDLDTISFDGPGGSAGILLVLSAASGSRTVVVKNSTGNIYLSGSDFSLDNINDVIVLAGTADGSGWLEVARGNNGA